MQIGTLTEVGNGLAITVPAAYRRKLGWLKGEKLVLVLEDTPGETAACVLRIWSINNAIRQGPQAKAGPEIKRPRL